MISSALENAAFSKERGSASPMIDEIVSHALLELGKNDGPYKDRLPQVHE